MAGSPPAGPGETFCGHCGQSGGERDHTTCEVHLQLEPPRFCASCGRRMKVQVTPTHWSAACVEHGVLNG